MAKSNLLAYISAVCLHVSWICILYTLNVCFCASCLFTCQLFVYLSAVYLPVSKIFERVWPPGDSFLNQKTLMINLMFLVMNTKIIILVQVLCQYKKLRPSLILRFSLNFQPRQWWEWCPSSYWMGKWSRKSPKSRCRLRLNSPISRIKSSTMTSVSCACITNPWPQQNRQPTQWYKSVENL